MNTELAQGRGMGNRAGLRRRAVTILVASGLIATLMNVATAPQAQAADRWTYKYTATISASSQLSQARNWANLAARVGAGCAASTFINTTIRSLSRTFSAGWTIGHRLVSWLSGGDSACQAARKMATAAYHLYYNGYRRGVSQTYRVWVLREDVFMGIDRCKYYVWAAGTWRVGGSGVPPITTGRPPGGCFGE